ncbi:MAG: protein NO VEIN domain-containing protein [Candidatus Eutrophobiaceae bacterium]
MIGRNFGQHERLTGRLHNLVRSYPKGLGVLKEFIQNADDSTADEIIFLIDEQIQDIDGLPPSMQWLHQTPALLVYNNKPFSADDIIGIQKIGESGKSLSVGKTGRFGLGFNACYNVTDAPSFFTGNELHFFDPHCKTVPDANLESPGRSFTVNELISEGWPLLEGFSHFISTDDEFSGTAFRLPFRSNDQAINSEIKREAYTVADAIAAVKELQQMGSAMLLFLKHVRRIKVEQRGPNGLITNLLTISANNPDEIASSRSSVNDLLSNPNVENILTHLSDQGDTFSSCKHEYTVELNGLDHIETWRVVDGFFIDAKKGVIDMCRNMIQNEEKALPYAGAAWPIDSQRDTSGRLFCFLPIPAQMGLPIQINGYFDLDDSRQNLFLDQSVHGVARLRFDWNKTLLETSVPQAYVRLLNDMQSDLDTIDINAYYSAFPELVEGDSNWESWLTSAFYTLASTAPLLRCSGESTWCELKVIRLTPPELNEVRDALLADNFLPIPDPSIPLNIQKGFEKCHFDVPFLSPAELRTQLYEEQDVNCDVIRAPRACLRALDYVRDICRFCLSDNPGKDFRKLPLIIDTQDHLRTVGLTENPLYIAKSRWDIDVFLDHPEWFVDQNFARDLELSQNIDANLLEMDSGAFVTHLAEYITGKTDDGDPAFSKAKNGLFTDSWLKSVFNRLLKSNLGSLEDELYCIPLIPDQLGFLRTLNNPSTPLLFKGEADLKRSLTTLSVPLVTGVSDDLRTILEEFSEAQDCIRSITPRNLIDMLMKECSEKLQEYDIVSEIQIALLDYLGMADSLSALIESDDRQSALRSLKIFPSTKGTLITLEQPAYIPKEFDFPSIASEVVLLDDGKSHKWRKLFCFLKVPELSRARLIQEVLLPKFADLNVIERIDASTWLRDNLSMAQSEDGADDLFDAVRNAPIIICNNGELRSPVGVYQPDSKLANAVLGDKAPSPDMVSAYKTDPERWLGFFRQLNMPIEPRLADVLKYVQLLAKGDSDIEKASKIQIVYEFIKNRVTSELQKSQNISEEMEGVLAELSDTPWIPLRQESRDLLCFKVPDDYFSCPSKVYFPRVGQLIASQAPITILKHEPNRRVRKIMGFPEKAPIELVIKHFQEVLNACSETETMPKEKILVKALRQIYRFFGGQAPAENDELEEETEGQDIVDTHDLESDFHDVPCLWDQKTQKFWIPDHVFKDNTEYLEPWRCTILYSEDAIERGYTTLGRREKPTIDDLKQVLVEISSNQSEIRNSEHSQVIHEIICRIVLEKNNNDEKDGEVLVPTLDGRMLPAEQVFLADAPWYESMLSSWGIPILSSSVSGIRGIQCALEISSLAGAVEQRLTMYPNESDSETGTAECKRLEDVLRLNEFALGFQRMLRHEEHEVSYESLSTKLQCVRVRCVKVIKTSLYLWELDSERFLGDSNADFYWDDATGCAMLSENRHRYFCEDLAELINCALGDNSLKNLTPMVTVLRNSSSEISDILDDLRVREFVFDREEKPEPRDTVTPQEFPDEIIDEYVTTELGETGNAIEDVTGDSEGQVKTSYEQNSNTRIDHSGNANHVEGSSEASTATRPMRDSLYLSDQQFEGNRPGTSQANPNKFDRRKTLSAVPGTRIDLEKRELSNSQENHRSSSAVSRKSKRRAQSRIVSYVTFEGHECNEIDDSPRNNSHKLRIGEAAVKIVIKHEQNKGRKAQSMAHSNPGYDVISGSESNPRYIEVKGIEGTWGERGAAMTSKQFFYARENQDCDYWLYVVEGVFSDTPHIFEIQNPSKIVNQFIFDAGWKQVAETSEITGVKMVMPSPGDEVIENDKVIGVVKSILPAGKFPLVIFCDLFGRLQKKLLRDLIIQAKET